MFQGSPFDTPSSWRGHVNREIGRVAHRRLIDREPEFSMAGWRGCASIAFATAPATVFVVIVLLHMLAR